MDYKRIYDDLMQSRLLMKEDRIKLRKMGDYFEAHHIIPKSMGGLGCVKNIKHANIVLLTGREHYLAHALLFLVYRNRAMAAAFNITCIITKNKGYVPSARMYEFLKLERRLLGVSDETKEKIRKANLGRKMSPESIEKVVRTRKKNKQLGLTKKYIPSDETRKKMRQSHLGKKLSPEQRKKISNSNIGKKLSTETKEKLRQSKLGKKLSPEHIEKIRQANLGRKQSPESIEKTRQANLGRKMSPEAIEKRLNTWKKNWLMGKHDYLTKRTHSPETKEKIRQAHLGKKKSPEHIEKMRQSKLGEKRSPEHIAKAVENRKKNKLLKLAKLNGDIDWSRWEENK